MSERSEAYREALALWSKQKETKYSDIEIKQVIEYAYTGNLEYSGVQAQTAMAMIAYNEMIDNRIENARKSWGLK